MRNRTRISCPECGSLLFKWHPSGDATVEIKCRRCKSMLTITGQTVTFTQDEQRLTA